MSQTTEQLELHKFNKDGESVFCRVRYPCNQQDSKWYWILVLAYSIFLWMFLSSSKSINDITFWYKAEIEVRLNMISVALFSTRTEILRWFLFIYLLNGFTFLCCASLATMAGWTQFTGYGWPKVSKECSEGAFPGLYGIFQPLLLHSWPWSSLETISMEDSTTIVCRKFQACL